MGIYFRPKRILGINSLANTINNFQSDCKAEELIQVQFNHWVKPKMYEDTTPFLLSLQGIPVYILSNIDTSDIHKATTFHEINVKEILTSEEVKSYKPRPELFLEALRRANLNPDEVVHIGDSITSDIKGAQSLGIRTIWLNRLNKNVPEDIKAYRICKDLNEVQTFLK